MLRARRPTCAFPGCDATHDLEPCLNGPNRFYCADHRVPHGDGYLCRRCVAEADTLRAQQQEMVERSAQREAIFADLSEASEISPHVVPWTVGIAVGIVLLAVALTVLFRPG
ncbi:MAG: hypothetical protein NZ518_01375 [Dehalococcoidia bacterium]|nr:hypothetical protein [Dehalococcoidia bacterium]